MTILLKELKKTLKKHYDVFLTSASYEKRCLSIMDAVNNVIDFNYKFVSLSIPHKDLMKENLEIFKRNKFVIIEINNAEQVKTATNFIEHIGQVLNENPKATFLVDITTFTKQTLLILLRILRESLYESNQIQFLYTPAEEYSIGLEYADKWLSRGVIKVNSILGFAGIIKPSNLYHLVILMGYEVERAAALINAYEPSKISVGYARKDDSISDAHYQINKLKYDELLSEFPYAESFEFSGTKILDCKQDILKQVERYSNYNVVVSPMNNKISTLSCALAAFDNDKIQLAIAIPAIYNHENYSKPSNYCYVIDVSEFIKLHSPNR